MNIPTSASFIARDRPPRVRIEYEVQLHGEPKMLELPFVMGVMSDLSGDAKEPLAPVEGRKFFEVTVDNFDARMKSIKPRAAFTVPNTLTGTGELVVDLTFECTDDFAPGAVAQHVPGVGEWLIDRERLWNLVAYEDGMQPETVTKIQSMFEDRELLELLAARPLARRTPADGPNGGAEIPAPAVSGRDEFFLNSLTQAFGLQGPRPELERTVETFARWVIRRGVRPTCDWMSAAKECVWEIDAKLSEQLNLILHSERFQQVESAWRGLHFLVTRTESGELLKIRVMNVSKAELVNMLERYEGVAWDQSPLFKKLYEEAFTWGEPYGCLVGDYYFDHSPADVALLASMARMAAHCHAPFLAGTAPSLMGMESWQELANPKDFEKMFGTAEYAAWRSLRDSDEARYLGLAMPRFLARPPYGEATSPVHEFGFEEETGSGEHSKYTWANAAYAMAVNIGRSFELYGWCASIAGIESGGVVEGMPVHRSPDTNGGTEMKCPTEISIYERMEHRLAKGGLMPLIHRRLSDMAAFFGAQSLHRPAEYATDDASANARLASRLPYVFAVSRLAQFLIWLSGLPRCFQEAEWYERHMNDWLQQYVLADPAGASNAERAARPLRHALVTVNDVAGRPGLYVARLEIEPHYLLPYPARLTANLKLTVQ